MITRMMMVMMMMMIRINSSGVHHLLLMMMAVLAAQIWRRFGQTENRERKQIISKRNQKVALKVLKIGKPPVHGLQVRITTTDMFESVGIRSVLVDFITTLIV